MDALSRCENFQNVQFLLIKYLEEKYSRSMNKVVQGFLHFRF